MLLLQNVPSSIGDPVKAEICHYYSMFYNVALSRLSWDKVGTRWVNLVADG